MRVSLIIVVFSIVFTGISKTQNFIRHELPTFLNTPWEITYGPDGFLWITESQGKVVRVNPEDGSKDEIYKASDYFGGSPMEKLSTCFQPGIGSGTLGLALHPDFPDSAFIYYVYSYNSGMSTTAATKFKIVRLRWEVSSQKVVEATDLVLNLPTGHDHLGGRLIAIKQNGKNYLYLSIGDNGISEVNSPSCYGNQNNNPNNFTQNPNYLNGKIHRFNMDGSIPSDNPIKGNSFYTRGHRNPQGLIYNPDKDIIYDVEHGDRTDDEINILIKGMNYGWKNVKGYHYDNNFEGEQEFIDSYEPNPLVENDSLVEPIYSWCATSQPTDPNNMNWCTVAPSDGIYYNSTAIPQWTNSLLVVTLKNGSNTDQEVFQFKLTDDGKNINPSTQNNPNPQTFFAEDQEKNGRLRDITVSPDGKKIFLINNGGTNADKITVYTYDDGTTSSPFITMRDLKFFPNPVKDFLNIESLEKINKLDIINMYGKSMISISKDQKKVDISKLSPGLYILKLKSEKGDTTFVFLKE